MHVPSSTSTQKVIVGTVVVPETRASDVTESEKSVQPKTQSEPLSQPTTRTALPSTQKFNPWFRETVVGGLDVVFRTGSRWIVDELLGDRVHESLLVKGGARLSGELIRKSAVASIRDLLNGKEIKPENFKLPIIAAVEQALSVMVADHSQVVQPLKRLGVRIVNSLSRIFVRLGARNIGIIKPTEFGRRDFEEMPTEVGVRAISSLFNFENQVLSNMVQQSIINTAEGVERVINDGRYLNKKPLKSN